MKKTCKGCVWYGNCDGGARCEYYDPIDETEEVVRKEDVRERQEFTSEWLRYFMRDDGMDFCGVPMIFDTQELSKTNVIKGGG